MKKTTFILVIILSLMLTSCQGAGEVQDKGKKQSDELMFPMKKNGYLINKLQFPQVPNYRLASLDWVDEKNLLIILRKYPTPKNATPEQMKMHKIFIFNIHSRVCKEIYKGPFFGGAWDTKLKHLDNGDLGLQGNRNLLVFDRDTFELIRVIDFPDKAIEVDISNDGQRAVFINDTGLYISDSNFKNTILCQEKNSKASWPTVPAWSPDGKRIMYFMYTPNFVNNTITIKKVVGDEIKRYEFTNGMIGFWFRDGRRIVAYCPGVYGKSVPRIKVINTVNGVTSTFEKNQGQITIWDSPVGDNILYVYHNDLLVEGEDKNILKTEQFLVSLDYKTKEEIYITPVFFEIKASKFSPSGQTIAFLGRLKKTLHPNIYIAYRIR